MRIAAALRVLDEVDLIEGALRHLRELGVDVVVVLDEGSTDGTLSRLEAIEAEGWLWLVHVEPDAAGIDTLEARLLDELRADWQLRLAAGDRLVSATGSLRDPERLEGVDELSIERYPVAVTAAGLDPAAWLDQAGIRSTEIHVSRVVPPGPRPAWRDVPRVQTLRPAPLRLVRRPASAPPGGETAAGQELRSGIRRRTPDELVAIAAPLTGWDRFRRQVASARAQPRTWLDGIRDPAPAWIVQRWTAMEEPTLRRSLEQQLLEPSEVARLQGLGIVRPASALVAPLHRSTPRLPDLADTDAYTEALRSPEPWMDGLRAAAAGVGLDPALPVRHLPARYPTALIGDAVVRLYGPWRRGVSAMAQEATVLRWLEQDPPLPVPRLLGTGWVDPTWAWLAMSVVPGAPLAAVRRGLGHDELRDLAAWIGDIIRRLHQIPVEAALRRSTLPGVIDGVRALYDSVPERHRAYGTLHPRLVERLRGWLPPIEALLPLEEDLVLAHLDLHDDNVLGTFVRGRFRGTGVIDFGNAWVGHPLQELGALCGQTLRGDPEAIAEFLRHAELPLPDGPERARVALSWMLLDDADQLALVPGTDAIDDPEVLATRLFGPSIERREGATENEVAGRWQDGRLL